MQYVGLLTDTQKCAGYFVTQDDDFVYLWHRRNGNPERSYGKGLLTIFGDGGQPAGVLEGYSVFLWNLLELD